MQGALAPRAASGTLRVFACFLKGQEENAVRGSCPSILADVTSYRVSMDNVHTHSLHLLIHKHTHIHTHTHFIAEAARTKHALCYCSLLGRALLLLRLAAAATRYHATILSEMNATCVHQVCTHFHLAFRERARDLRARAQGSKTGQVVAVVREAWKMALNNCRYCR